MLVFGLTSAAIIVLLPPVAAALLDGRRRAASIDAVEMVGIGYAAFGIAALSLWVGALWGGTSMSVMAIAPAAGSLLVVAGARVTSPQAATAAGEQGDPAVGRGVATRLSWTAALFVVSTALPFLSYGLERAGAVHRMAMTDWYKHLVVTTALEAGQRFPPPNPFLRIDESAPYYYGFHLVGAAIARLAAALGGAGLDFVYPSLLMLTLITAAATPFVTFAAARSIINAIDAAAARSGRAPLLAAVGATLLAGFDLVPWAVSAVRNLAAAWPIEAGLTGLRAVAPSVSPDFWIHHNERQFNAPYMTALWAPQHLAAVLVALLVVHFVVRDRASPGERFSAGLRRGRWIRPAALLAALPALSAYVALALVAGVAGTVAVETLSARGALRTTTGWRLWLLPALGGAVLSVPVVAALGGSSSQRLIAHVSSAGDWGNGAVLTSVFGSSQLVNLLDTPAVFAVELGIVGLLGMVEIVRRARAGLLGDIGGHIATMVVVILVLVTFVRPPLDGPNNLYARSLVMVWFLLAPFAALGSQRLRPGRPFARGLAVGVCLAANGLALVGMTAEGRLFWASSRDAVESVRQAGPNGEPGTLAVHPDDFDALVGYWSRRPLALADRRHALLFGATPAEYDAAAAALRAAYDAAAPAEAAAAFDRFEAGYLLFDRAGRPPPGWIDSDCFRTLRRGEEWLLVARQREACGGAAAATGSPRR